MRVVLPLRERFWRMVEVRGLDECWGWKGAVVRTKWGYGKIGAGGKRVVSAHRLSFEINVGPIPDGLFVLHSCDNPPCTNPKHLRLGTASDNFRDAMIRRRGKWHLSYEKAEAIRADAAKTGNRYGTGVRLAREYGVSSAVISHVLTGNTWKRG